MEFILSTAGRSTSGFETWLKSLKELNDSLLINFDFGTQSIKSVAYTNDKTAVKRAEISFEDAGFEVNEVIDDSGNHVSCPLWAEANPGALVRFGIYQQLDKFIKVVGTYAGAENYTLTLTAASRVTENNGPQILVTKADFRSKSLTMSVAGAELTEFHIISDDAFHNNIAAISNPMKFAVDVDTVKMLLSVSSIYSTDVKKDVVDFKTMKNEAGEWTLHAIDRNGRSYDFIIAYMTPGETEPAEITLPVTRNNFILATKGDIDNSTISISADENSGKIRIDTGDNINTIIAAVRV